MRSFVEAIIKQQGNIIGIADNNWTFLVTGKFAATPEMVAQAQSNIAEDGYWSVEQTSKGIVEFAKTLSGGDSREADELLTAFEKGYTAATKSWGNKLPDIIENTYDTTVEKFENRKNKTQKDAID